MVTIKLPWQVSLILEKLNENGHEAYIVGGCVRDCILGRKPQDWDITTSAEPLEVKKCFPHTYDTGIQHGTVTVLIQKKGFEVTTYRIDGKYEDCRRPDQVYFTRNLKEDLLRRDFTMNAIAYHPLEGYIDPFDGRQDIKVHIIRGVGDAELRFQEDALRMLRAVRFSAQLDFLIEQKTKLALASNSHLIQKISAERIKEELQKLLLADYNEALYLLWDSGLMNFIIPELGFMNHNAQSKLIVQLKSIEKNECLRWSVFLQYLEIDKIKIILKGLRFDTKTMRMILLLNKHKNDILIADAYQIRKKVFEIGLEGMELLLKLKSVCTIETDFGEVNKLFLEIQQRNDTIFLKDLAVDGTDLFDVGIKKGKEMGIILLTLLDLVHKDPLNNERDILLEKAKKMCN